MVRPEIKKRRRQLAEAALASRKEKKRLEKVVLRKKHKIDRNAILAELKKVQLSSDQLNKLHSTSSMQTIGLKRFVNDELKADISHQSASLTADECLDARSLIKKKRRKIRTARATSSGSSESEDTDDVSTDTEIYHDWSTENKEDAIKVESEKIQKSPQTIKCETQIPQKQNGQVPIQTREIIKSEPAIFVEVTRSEEVEKSRSELPIINEEQRIMEEIRYNDVVIISGETGSGKTTQLPQFLYEAGYALNSKVIGITEPRRVAAVAMSERVAHELNLTDEEVAYQIRFAGNVSESTMIKFMTDGVLLKECQHDFLLSRYSVLIIDEAHERSIFSDILIGLLSRIVPLRRKKGDPLKLVIMSATLRVKDFTENSFLFPITPPVINIDARQFPVTVQFARRTPDNYLEAAYKKVVKLHAKMPKGGILVFVTSQMDVKILCKRLKHKSHLHCLGFYAMLPLDKQQLVFKKPPEGERLCVIATNVAETSITIPNIKYVVDTGMEKRKCYDLLTGVSKFVTTWTTKSSAEQRTGRAGRVGPGYCFRLYSSAVFTNDFVEFAEPQILQRPLEDVMLQMKTMNIDNVVNFPFPTRPPLEALRAAEKKLVLLGALDDSESKIATYSDTSKTEYASRPTSLGKAMSDYSLGARCSKMMVLAPDDLKPHVICIVSALTVREMLINDNQFSDLRKKWAGHTCSKLLGDFMVMLKAVMVAEALDHKAKSCQANGLRPKAMIEIYKLRRQLINDAVTKQNIPEAIFAKKIQKLTEEQCKILRKLIFSSFCDHIATKLPDGEIVMDGIVPSGNGQPPTKRRLRNAYECKETSKPVYISSESVFKGKHPSLIVYKELYEGDKKTYMRDVAVVDPEWLTFYTEKLSAFNS